MYLLPTKSGRRYRGKYPDTIHSLGYSNSLSQQVIGGYLSINRPIHIELNNGRRYIAAAAEIDMAKAHLGADFNDVIKSPHEIIALLQERYDEMMAKVRKVRGIDNDR